MTSSGFNMTITIPGIRNQHGARTSDIISEQILICKANLETLKKLAFYRKNREIRDEINRRLRSCHDFLGMGSSRKLGCLYREVNLKPTDAVVCEHAIPVTALVSLYQSGVNFEDLVFYPVARISKLSDMRFNKLGLTKSGHDKDFPFLRYHKASIRIETYLGEEIDCKKWSIDDHWKLVNDTRELFTIRSEVMKSLAQQSYA